jgi:hypothetical protein
VKKSWHFLFLFTFFLSAHFSALAQPPKPNWVDNLGGTSRSAIATSLALDNENNVYVTGQFEGTVDFDPSAGVKNLTSAGGYDIFVGKYTQGGTLIWVESIGGTGNEVPNGLAVDKDGNVSIIGYFTSATLNANPGGGVYNLNNPTGSPDPFIIHLNTSGGFLWANAFQLTEPSGEDGGYRVATDSQDDVIATYSFSSALTIGDSTYAATAGSNGLVVKYGPTGNVLWNLCLKGQSEPDVVAWGAAVDGQDNIVISGSIDSTVNFNPLGVAFTLTAANDTYASFVAKYSPAGALLWANGINSNSEDLFVQSAVSIDPQNNVYFSTPFDNSVFPGSLTLYDPSNYGPNICIAKYSPAGVLQFAKQIGGPGNLNYGTVMANDKAGNTYLNGSLNFATSF